MIAGLCEMGFDAWYPPFLPEDVCRACKNENADICLREAAESSKRRKAVKHKPAVERSTQ